MICERFTILLICIITEFLRVFSGCLCLLNGFVVRFVMEVEWLIRVYKGLYRVYTGLQMVVSVLLSCSGLLIVLTIVYLFGAAK